MTEHFEATQYIAAVADSRAESAAVRRHARALSETSEDELSVLRREDDQLARAGVASGAITEQPAESVPALEAVRPFDSAFLAVVAQHDRASRAVARVELERGRDPELRALATRLLERVGR